MILLPVILLTLFPAGFLFPAMANGDGGGGGGGGGGGARRIAKDVAKPAPLPLSKLGRCHEVESV